MSVKRVTQGVYCWVRENHLWSDASPWFWAVSLLALCAAFSALVLYVGVEGEISPICFIRCEAPGDKRAVQVYWVVFTLFSVASALLDLISLRKATVIIFGLAVLAALCSPMIMYIGLAGSIGGFFGTILGVPSLLYLVGLPYVLAVNVFCASLIVFLRYPRSAMVTGLLAAGIVLVVPQVYVRTAIAKNAELSFGGGFCLIQGVHRHNPIVTRDVWSLTLGWIISTKTPRVYLASESNLYTWRFREFAFVSVYPDGQWSRANRINKDTLARCSTKHGQHHK